MINKYYSGLVLCLFFMLSLISLPLGYTENLKPLMTEDANVITPGTLQLRISAEYLEDKNLAFEINNKDRDVAVLPGLNINLGLSKIVEIQAYIDGLYVDEEGYDSAYGGGDLCLFTKVKFKQETNSPAAGFRFGVKLPTASNEDRLGTDETDFYSWLLLSKHFNKASCHLNLGLGILSDPHQNSSQDDVFCYGLGFVIPLSSPINLAIEVNGQAASGENNNFSHALVGLQIKNKDLSWDLGVSGGLTDESQDWSIKIGLTKDFDNFIKL